MRGMGSRAEEFASGAKLYMECALAADDKIGVLPGFEIHAPYPVMSNVAHAIELALKSYLLANGVADIKQFGHDLVAAFNACKGTAGPDNKHLGAIDVRLLEIVSDIHQNMTLRYGQPSKLGRLPVFGPLNDLANHCLKLCGAPTRQELWGE